MATIVRNVVIFRQSAANDPVEISREAAEDYYCLVDRGQKCRVGVWLIAIRDLVRMQLVLGLTWGPGALAVLLWGRVVLEVLARAAAPRQKRLRRAVAGWLGRRRCRVS